MVQAARTMQVQVPGQLLWSFLREVSSNTIAAAMKGGTLP
jgi:hypothetical protein